MKKIISVFIVLMFVLMASVETLAVDGGSISVETISDTVKIGTEFSVGVCITKNPNIGAITFGIDYDSERVELIGYSNGSLSGWTVGSSAVWVSASGSTATGEILVLNFRVKDGAKSGFARITLTNVDCVAQNEEAIKYSVVGGGVNVEGIAESSAPSEQSSSSGDKTSSVGEKTVSSQSEYPTENSSPTITEEQSTPETPTQNGSETESTNGPKAEGSEETAETSGNNVVGEISVGSKIAKETKSERIPIWVYIVPIGAAAIFVSVILIRKYRK